MKNLRNFLLAAAAVATVSCAIEIEPIENENPTPEVELVPMTFTASYDASEPETKVAYEEGATVWKVGDKIMVISATGTATEFEATEVTNNGKSATFEGLTENANEYYAVYPASAYKGTPEYVTDANGGKLVVEVPAVQHAVAGTFHESAILCIANTKGNTFQFKHSCAFFKFQLANPEGVKSVRLAVNGSDNVAGVGYVGVNATDMNPKYASSDSNMSAYEMITLNAPEGGFAAETDYFIAMRANSCPNGITVYIEYENTIKSRTTTNKVFTDGSIGKIRNLGQLDINLRELTLYDRYQMGENIVIGDKVYNKSNHSFELLTASKENDPTLRTKIHQKTGEFYLFLDSGEYNFELGSYTTIEGDVVMIGNNPHNPTKVSFTQISRINRGSVAMSNLDITPMQGNRTLETSNATGDIAHIIFDNCRITNLNSNLIYVNKTYKINDIQFKNCDIKINGNNAVLVKSYVSNNYANISYINNVIYNSGDLNTNFKLFCDNQTKGSELTKCVIDNNTFVNTYASTTYLVYTDKCSNITITDNLMYYPNAITSGTGYLRGITTYPELYNVSNNIAFNTSSHAIRYWYNNTILDSNENTIKDGTNPFSTYDLTKGTFVQSPSYQSFGATR